MNSPKTSKQNPLPVLPLRKVGDGVTELSMPKLKENLDTLHNSVLSEMEVRDTHFGETTVRSRFGRISVSQDGRELQGQSRLSRRTMSTSSTAQTTRQVNVRM